MDKSVLIATDNHVDAQKIGRALEQVGYDAIIWQFDGLTIRDIPEQVPCAVLLHFTDYIDSISAVKAALSQKYAPRELPFIGALAHPGTAYTGDLDSVMFPPYHPAQIAHRVNSIIRLNTMQAEIALRLDTLREDFGIEHLLSDGLAKQPLRILFVGKASPDFMVLINALEQNDVEVVAAFTSFSAFDFLYETTFDAVIISALDGSPLAMSLMETMRRNSRLYHVPVVLLTPQDYDEKETAYEKGAADLIWADLSKVEIKSRVIELAKFHRLQHALREEFKKLGHRECQDVSGTYNMAFFTAHLSRLADYYAAQSKPVSLVSINLAVDPKIIVVPQRLTIALAQAGRIIKNIVRVEDVTARLLPDRFVVAAPGMSAAECQALSDRICQTLQASAFDTGLPNAPTFVFEVTHSTTEITDKSQIEPWLAAQHGGAGDSDKNAAPLSQNLA